MTKGKSSLCDQIFSLKLAHGLFSSFLSAVLTRHESWKRLEKGGKERKSQEIRKLTEKRYNTLFWKMSDGVTGVQTSCRQLGYKLRPLRLMLWKFLILSPLIYVYYWGWLRFRGSRRRRHVPTVWRRIEERVNFLVHRQAREMEDSEKALIFKLRWNFDSLASCQSSLRLPILRKQKRDERRWTFRIINY